MQHLDELYHSIIREHNKNPLNYFKNEDVTHKIEAYNPLCGDHFHLYFDIHDNRITNLSFHGYGCAVSKASASIFTKKMNGLTLDEALSLYERFYACAVEGKEIGIKDFLPFQVASKFPGREKCASLTWESFKEYVDRLK